MGIGQAIGKAIRRANEQAIGQVNGQANGLFQIQGHQPELLDSVKPFLKNGLEQNHESNIFWKNIH